MPEFHDDWDELAIVRAREKAEKTLGANGADGISNIEGKVARVAASKLGNERVSNSTSALSTMLCSSSARYRCPLSPRGSTASSLKTAKALTRIRSEWVSGVLGEQTDGSRPISAVALPAAPPIATLRGVKFRVTIESDEDGVFVAECPALPGCISQGKTRDEAMANIRDADQGYVESLDKARRTYSGSNHRSRRRSLACEPLACLLWPGCGH